jgi:hypothetical protein
MIKWVRITKTYWFGIFAVGLVLLFLQELPYIIMPLIPLESNLLLEMEDKIACLNFAEKTIGILCVLLMLFLVRADSKWFSPETRREKICFAIALAALLTYYIGWVLYFTGNQSLLVLLGILVAMPPIYYSFIGLWRRNTPLAVLGIVFLAVHMTNVSVNLIGG